MTRTAITACAVIDQVMLAHFTTAVLASVLDFVNVGADQIFLGVKRRSTGAHFCFSTRALS